MNLQTSITRLEKDKRTLETEVKSYCSISISFCLYELLSQNLESLKVSIVDEVWGNVETTYRSGEVRE